MSDRLVNAIIDSEINNELIELMKVLAEPNRLKIMQIMYHCSEHSVTKLSGLINTSQPATSQHLKILRQAGILSSRKEGRQMIYFIDQKEIMRRYGKCIRHIREFFNINGNNISR